jgi:hypothetical protein
VPINQRRELTLGQARTPLRSGRSPICGPHHATPAPPMQLEKALLDAPRLAHGRPPVVNCTHNPNETALVGDPPVVRKARERPVRKAVEVEQRSRKPEINRKEEEILRRAQTLLLLEAKCPMLWTVAGIKEERASDGSCRWTIAVHLRFPTGYEGYLGDLSYDGTKFTQLTDPIVMQQRAQQIADDPERERRWREYQASCLPPREG